MSAQPIEKDLQDDDRAGSESLEDVTGAPDHVEVRRNALVSLVIGAAAAGIAIAYLWRAAGTGALLDWALFGVLAAIALTFLHTLLDSRLPLLVADELGVRIRLATQWRGLPWEAIQQITVQPRRGLRDGRVVVRLHHVQRAVEDLEGRARRHAALNQKVYGASLAVPLALTTRVAGADAADHRTLADRVGALAHGRTEVVTLLDEPVLPVTPAPSVPAQAEAPDEAVEQIVISDLETSEPGRRPRWRRRGEETEGTEVETPARTVDAEDRGSRSATVRSIARLGEPVPPLVITDFEPEPAYDPVIGPELAAARTRVGLSVDELADRTRIRPHVIESIEVDDFAPCGGDFYARGHIRTLARVLGKDAEPMLELFEARYAHAPINARRVFEAELATGMTGSMRSTSGGPNWALLVGVVLTLVLVWSAVRLFAGDTQDLLENPPPVLNGSAGIDNVYDQPIAPPAAPPVVTTLTAVNAGTAVEVRDGDGALVFEGDLVIGEVRTLRVDPPVTVTSDNGGALSVRVGGEDMGFLGDPDVTATRTFQRPAG